MTPHEHLSDHRYHRAGCPRGFLHHHEEKGQAIGLCQARIRRSPESCAGAADVGVVTSSFTSPNTTPRGLVSRLYLAHASPCANADSPVSPASPPTYTTAGKPTPAGRLSLRLLSHRPCLCTRGRRTRPHPHTPRPQAFITLRILPLWPHNNSPFALRCQLVQELRQTVVFIAPDDPPRSR